MRRKPIHAGAAALILAGIYLAGLLLGSWVLTYLFGASKRPGLVYTANSLAADYLESGQVNPSTLSGVCAVVYNCHGHVLDVFQAGSALTDHDFEEQGRRILPQVLNGSDSLRLVLFAEDISTLGYSSLIYVGVPMELEDGPGALIWARELKDLLEAILGYIGVFTAVFAFAALFMILTLRNQRKYESLRRHYVDNITHELKTPVSSIKALVEALSDGMEKSPADRNVYYGMILRDANRQERMIRDILELSKLQNQGFVFTKTRISAAALFEPVLEKYETLCDYGGIHMHVSDELFSLPVLYTDETFTRHLLELLLDNALKFVPEGGDIWVEASTTGKTAVISVRDNGIGIEKDALPHVFDRFFKGNHDFNAGGSGLGLAIAQEITDGLKEKLWVTSEAGKGSIFSFTVHFCKS